MKHEFQYSDCGYFDDCRLSIIIMLCLQNYFQKISFDKLIKLFDSKFDNSRILYMRRVVVRWRQHTT